MSLGLVLGLRHALEADHLAAVATIVNRERSPVRSGFLGGFWGLGHLSSLLLVGLPVIGLGLKFPEQLNLPLELGVAAMIVFLGVGSLTRSHARHAHPHSLRALAGSGALTLVILATMPSRMDGILYLGLFGAGSTAGMMAASVILSIPIAASGFAGPSVTLRIGRAVAFASVIFGLFYGATTIVSALARHPFS